MFVIRPIKQNHLEALEQFAFSTTLGMISLPQDRKLLRKKIEKSLESFSKHIQVPKNEFYLFVLEDIRQKEAVGSCGIYAKKDEDNPLFCFRIETLFPKKNGFPVPNEMKILHPIIDTDGPSELCSLFLKRNLRKDHLGELLSRSRFLFIAQHLNRFTTLIQASLRGFINHTRNYAPFWEGCGKHFLNISFQEIQILQQKNPHLLQKYLPKYPIYLPLLPKQSQYVIQKTHTHTRPALKMLIKEGFAFNDMIDMFDGGPYVAAQTGAVKSVKYAITATISEITKQEIQSEPYIISNALIDFRACYGNLHISNDKVVISEECSEALQVQAGEKILFIPAKW